MSEYPRALYHTAIEKPRNVFGRIIPGAEPVNTGDLVSPGNVMPIDRATNKGHVVGQHFIPQHHYKTMLCVVYDGSHSVDEAASKRLEESLAKEGWVRSPDLLKEDYEPSDK